MLPLFPDVAINEGDELVLTCINTNPPIVSTAVEILDPNGEVVNTHVNLDTFRVLNTTMNYTGTYTCLISSTVSNDTVMTTAHVAIQCLRECNGSNGPSNISGASFLIYVIGLSVSFVCLVFTIITLLIIK